MKDKLVVYYIKVQCSVVYLKGIPIIIYQLSTEEFPGYFADNVNVENQLQYIMGLIGFFDFCLGPYWIRAE